MDDPEIKKIFEKFINDESMDDHTKIFKMRKLLIEFCDRWAEERTLTAVSFKFLIQK